MGCFTRRCGSSPVATTTSPGHVACDAYVARHKTRGSKAWLAVISMPFHENADGLSDAFSGPQSGAQIGFQLRMREGDPGMGGKRSADEFVFGVKSLLSACIQTESGVYATWRQRYGEDASDAELGYSFGKSSSATSSRASVGRSEARRPLLSMPVPPCQSSRLTWSLAE
jgi:hypothetical protein